MLLKKADAPENWTLESVDFVNKCIARQPDCRLGINGTTELKSHVWFKEFEFKKLLKNTLKPAPFIPGRGDNFDRTNFYQTTDEKNMDTELQRRLNEELVK